MQDGTDQAAAGSVEPREASPEAASGARRGFDGDPVTMGLVVFFVAIIVIVAALLVMPMLGGSG